MQVTDQLRHMGIGLNQAVGKFHWMRGGVTNSVYAVDIGHIGQQFGKITD